MMIQTAVTNDGGDDSNVNADVIVKVVVAMEEVPHSNEVPMQCHGSGRGLSY